MTKRPIVNLIFCFCLCIFCTTLHAQNVTVTSAVGQNPQTIINQHLAGTGVLLTNGEFNKTVPH